jgi:hypothetical protein
MPRTRKPKTYKYTIELTQPIYPRHLADYMTMQPMFAQQLVSVQDLQRNDHTSCSYVNGDTYIVSDDPEDRKESAPRIEEALIKQLIDSIRNRCFDNSYEPASDEQCLGLALSHYFGYNGIKILQTTYRALEDGNYHHENETIEQLIKATQAPFWECSK